MASDGRPRIERLTTGVPGLDTVLGGGIPAGSLNIIAGGPGTGKSILMLQLIFHQARQARKSIYFVTIGEPSLKFLRYMQQFDFFDPGLVGGSVVLFDLSATFLAQGLKGVLDALRQQVRDSEPGAIVVDSFRAVREPVPDPDFRAALYEVAVDLAVSGVTTFLVGEYDEEDITHAPEFAAADGIIHLSTAVEGLRRARQIEVVKLRGANAFAGKHFFSISSAGVKVYPRVSVPAEHELARPAPASVPRLAFGVPGLDEMLGGGIPVRSVTVIEGATGTGKTLLALSFLLEGARRGEPGLFFGLDETREQIFEEGAARGWDMAGLERQGLLRVLYTSPVEVAGDALLQNVRESISRTGAQRAVLDALTTLSMGIAARDRYPELVYSISKTFRAEGVTTLFTAEVPELMGTTVLSGRGVSSMCDNIIRLRYVEIAGGLRRALAVLKMRGSAHERALRELEITGDAIRVGKPFSQYVGVLTGMPTTAEVPATRRQRKRPAPTESEEGGR